MRLHIRKCECGRFAIRLDGEKQWCRWLHGGYVQDVEAQHEVVSKEEMICEECNRRFITHIAMTAGAVH